MPGNATAVTGNVTVTGATSTAAVYVGPDPIVSPLASTINFAAGQVRANSLTVAIGQTGALNATLLASGTNTTDLVFDVTGYYTADATGAGYVPIAPDPLLDTGTGNGLSGKFTAGSPRTVAIGGRGRVPLTATGVAGIVSVRNQTANYALFIGPSPVAKPPVSNLNFVCGMAGDDDRRAQHTPMVHRCGRRGARPTAGATRGQSRRSGLLPQSFRGRAGDHRVLHAAHALAVGIRNGHRRLPSASIDRVGGQFVSPASHEEAGPQVG